MSSIRDFMSLHHRDCDGLFTDVENSVAASRWDKATAQWPLFLKELFHHFEMEERVLFPRFEQETGMTDGPTAMMRMEHDQMRSVTESLAAAMSKQDRPAFLGLAESMMVLLQQHNMKEEQILYPMTDRALSDVAEVLDSMKNV
ncbi:MAG: hemerythrin domain-containing protein [Candidatus Delongbacteria bacterium]|nr:hemerythrin domain-containing protein [Candidatus Delongbacteria bacterium]